MKTQIISELGQTDILLPALLAEGLAANNRIKVRMSALQAALRRAQEPGRPPVELNAESRAAGISPAALATLIGGAHLVGGSRMTAPNLAKLIEEITGDIAAMLDAVKAGEPAESEPLAARLAAIRAAGLLEAADEIEIARVAQLTAITQGGADSLHRLVMDLHKAINRLAALCSEEIVSGAHTFGLQTEDRDAVESFMKGLNATRGLKFNHPGLDTTANRSNGRLLIQNDIGETDAHVVVVAVSGNSVSVTYTDVHRPRAKFFIALFDEFDVEWSGLDRHSTSLGEDAAFYLVTGELQAGSRGDRDAFLTALGAALVFLIDWNKARKLLRNWVAKEDAIRILDWGARRRIGHRALLELGGNDLIGAAVRNAAPSRIRFGERLDQVLGRCAAADFIQSAMRISTEALSGGRSVRLVRDQIEADLIRHLERVDSTLLGSVLRQVGLAHDIIAAVAGHVAAMRAGQSTDGERLSARAGLIERKADRIAADARKEAIRLAAGSIIEQLIDRVEDAIDELEQAAFVASLAAAGMDLRLLSALAELCAVAISATEAAASGLAAAINVPNGLRLDTEDALNAIARIVDAEHAADRCEREITTLVFAGHFDVSTSLCAIELARAIERATDRLASVAHLLRRHIMADLSA
ncbi:MAG TPA: hypothetical protein VFL62_06655 [Bradyrhizobium sp.]|uniref:hypothetical protein n=1 Tax=Bradyrhizobium sp. TaxID=376 RepID=UPI002D7EC47E|nr:hypothetical protein [Bradyrhizobium sp.]HET7885886.1 hypothetical protein [Bradyrhizobium sp.]